MVQGAEAHTPSNRQHPALGIDHGEVRIGVAATDACGILAHPVETIDRRRTDPVARIRTLAAERSIRTLVIGLPLRQDGSEGDAAARAREFAAALSREVPGLPLVFIDESFSTAIAHERLQQAGRSTRKSKPVIDQAAAVEILERWMNPDPGPI